MVTRFIWGIIANMSFSAAAEKTESWESGHKVKFAFFFQQLQL